jgi:PhzF family phenazine biosynthesis protein
VIDQVVQGMLKAAGQQLSLEINGNEARAGVDVFVAGHAGLRKPISTCDPCYSIWFTAECGYEKTFSKASLARYRVDHMKLPLFQIDAFTNRLFGGNPAAVVLLENWLPDKVLAAIAAENNLAETAFVILKSDVIPLRWFTPIVEIDLCGHATLAAAHVLFRHFIPTANQLTFSTRSGNLVVTRDADRLTMDFPARPGTPVEVTEKLITALGIRPREAFLARDLLAIFDRESDVQNLQPDFLHVAALDAFAVIVSAPGETTDFVSRFFAPRAGIPEDPVTGSAHCTLVPYWAARLGKPELTARQLSARRGELNCRLAGDRVFMSGGTVEYLRGEIDVQV